MNKECVGCIKRKTPYCPTSMECMATEDMPYYRNRMMLLKENEQLKIQISAREEVCDRLESNWNKLKVYIKTEIPEDVFIDTEWFVSILDKMQELEQGSDSNE